jgi:hypothetical protein
LSVVDFIQFCLIPEAAIILIADDYKKDISNPVERLEIENILKLSNDFGKLLQADPQDDLIHGSTINSIII